MPIRINLLAEAQNAEEMRRRDPVKRGLWIAGIIVSLALFWSLMQQSKILIASARLSSVNNKWASLEKKYVQVMDNRSKVKLTEQKLSALVQLSTNRFLWASFLNVLQQCAQDDVQVLRLKAEQSYLSSDLRTNETKTAGAKAPSATERITVLFEARDYNAKTLGNMKLKETLANSALFQDIPQKTNVLLMNLSAPGPDANSPSGVAANFSLRCFFPDK